MNDEKEVHLKCPKHPEGGLRHEYIFCHCDIHQARQEGYEACKAQSVKIAEDARDRQLTPHYADAIVRELQEMKPKEGT